VRGHPRVRELFARLHHTTDLAVSFDGAQFWRPWGDNPAWRVPDAGPGFLHLDHIPFPRGAGAIPGASAWAPGPAGVNGGALGPAGTVYIQGFITLLPTTPATGGNIVIPRSHRRYLELAETAVARGWSDWPRMNRRVIQTPLSLFCMVNH
jgi:hypothetical protein